MNGFLYGQTEYNMLKNACHLDEYIEYAKEHGCSYLSITDPNLHGHYKFYKKCLKYGIKPLIGLEIKVKHDFGYDTLLLYAKNNIGYKNLLNICSMSHIKKEITIKDLIKFKDEILFVLSVNNSEFLNIIKQQEVDEASILLQEYRNLLENFYIGYSRQVEQLISYNDEIKTFARNFNILSIYIHKMCYLTKKDEIVYKTLLKIGNYEEKYDGDFSFLKEDITDEELYFNTEYFVKQINLELFNEKVKMPKFKGIKTEAESKNKLLYLATKGLNRRLHNNVSIRYQDRLNKELDIIFEMGFQDYFLIVWNFINYAKKNNILVGPGRGSAASSLVAYSLGITEIDPLEYNLFFERFLNPERITMPDIDTDFPDDKREEVIKYVASFYGKNHVSSISTFGTFSKKSAIRDVSKVFKLDEKNIKEIVAIFERYNDISDIFSDYINHELYDVIYTICRLDTLPRNVSVHAAGIIISDLNLFDYLPLEEGINNIFQSQLEASDLEELGFLKIDFLGLKNLSIIDNVLKSINKDYNYLRNINLNDINVLNQFTNKDTLGIFQFESQGMMQVLAKLKPQSFNDLVAVIALYRPGPMENIDEYIRRRHGEPFNYIHKDLEPILKETYGIIVYQEQIMQIANKFANYSLGAADVLRRAVSKKKLEILEEEREKFVTSSILNGYDKNIANEIYDYIVKFANYGFNKAHSVVYALLSYQMAYLKYYHFKEFISKILDNVSEDKKNLLDYIKYVTKKKVVVSLPDINISDAKFVTFNNKLYMPFNVVNQVSQRLAQKIVDERKKGPYLNLDDFINRNKDVDQDALHNLIAASSFDSFHVSKKYMIENKTNLKIQIDNFLKDVKLNNDEYDESELEQLELKALGFNYKYSSLRKLNIYRNNYNVRNNLSKLGKNYDDKYIIKIKEIQKRIDKNGNNYYVGIIYDEYDELKFYLFSDIKPEILSLTNYSGIYFVTGNLKNSEKYGKSFYISSITKIK